MHLTFGRQVFAAVLELDEFLKEEEEERRQKEKKVSRPILQNTDTQNKQKKHRDTKHTDTQQTDTQQKDIKHETHRYKTQRHKTSIQVKKEKEERRQKGKENHLANLEERVLICSLNNTSLDQVDTLLSSALDFIDSAVSLSQLFLLNFYLCNVFCVNVFLYF